jgi:hypothetical protein
MDPGRVEEANSVVLRIRQDQRQLCASQDYSVNTIFSVSGVFVLMFGSTTTDINFHG